MLDGMDGPDGLQGGSGTKLLEKLLELLQNLPDKEDLAEDEAREEGLEGNPNASGESKLGEGKLEILAMGDEDPAKKKGIF